MYTLNLLNGIVLGNEQYSTIQQCLKRDNMKRKTNQKLNKQNRKKKPNQTNKQKRDIILFNSCKEIRYVISNHQLYLSSLITVIIIALIV